MIIEILDLAEQDLVDGFLFYADIESLQLNAGVHGRPYKNYYRLLSQRFPFAVYYKTQENKASIHAVLDCRRDPVRLVERFK